MPCEEWTAFCCGDDKVVKWKIVQIEKNPRGGGIPKICRRGKRKLHFSRSEETLNLNFYNMYSSVFTTILIPMLGVKGSVASTENSLTDFNEFVFIISNNSRSISGLIREAEEEYIR
ncbi:MAG TPA: hypothetical protein VNB67_09060 [Nitrososphaeraceae archaeon]|nr:hypothetical protein [Nitrososphaeraceae archaeon]